MRTCIAEPVWPKTKPTLYYTVLEKFQACCYIGEACLARLWVSEANACILLVDTQIVLHYGNRAVETVKRHCLKTSTLVLAKENIQVHFKLPFYSLCISNIQMFLFSVSAYGQWTPPWMLLWIYKCIRYKITFFEVKNKTEHISVRATTSSCLFTSTFSKSL